QGAEALRCHMAVIGSAEDLLQLLYARIQFLAEGRIEAVGEYFHGVTQALAGDAHLMELDVVVEVAQRRLLKVLQEIEQHRPSEVHQDRGGRVVVGWPDGLDGMGEELLDGRSLYLKNGLQLGVGGGTLAESVADEEVEPRAMLGVLLLLARQQVDKKDVQIAGGAGRTTQLA